MDGLDRPNRWARIAWLNSRIDKLFVGPLAPDSWSIVLWSSSIRALGFWSAIKTRSQAGPATTYYWSNRLLRDKFSPHQIPPTEHDYVYLWPMALDAHLATEHDRNCPGQGSWGQLFLVLCHMSTGVIMSYWADVLTLASLGVNPDASLLCVTVIIVEIILFTSFSKMLTKTVQNHMDRL